MGVVGDGAKLIGEVKNAVEQTPKGKEAVALGGESAEIVMHTLRNVLLPLAAFNFAVDKAKHYFEDKFADDLEAKLEEIPAENIVEPKASIVGPAMQGLAYSFEEDDLREMYLNLLKASMDGRKPEGAHPAYVEIIKQLSAREAHLLSLVGRDGIAPTNFPLLRVKAINKGTPEANFQILHEHFMDVNDVFGSFPVDALELTRVIDNWSRLGLASIDYSTHLTAPGLYDFSATFPQIELVRGGWTALNHEIEFAQGILRFTALGKGFFEATVL